MRPPVLEDVYEPNAKTVFGQRGLIHFSWAIQKGKLPLWGLSLKSVVRMKDNLNAGIFVVGSEMTDEFCGSFWPRDNQNEESKHPLNIQQAKWKINSTGALFQMHSFRFRELISGSNEVTNTNGYARFRRMSSPNLTTTFAMMQIELSTQNH